MYGLPISYNPFSPHAQQPLASNAPDVPESRIEAAESAGAGWLSSDGLRIYCERFGAVLQAEWDGERFNSWWAVAELPADAVRLE